MLTALALDSGRFQSIDAFIVDHSHPVRYMMHRRLDASEPGVARASACMMKSHIMVAITGAFIVSYDCLVAAPGTSYLALQDAQETS